ncbi:MAG: hypothetical protein NZ603_03845 [Acidimicrobiales bacterium]|nr:hypothetical protein [Acidimicrobiales bacterium]
MRNELVEIDWSPSPAAVRRWGLMTGTLLMLVSASLRFLPVWPFQDGRDLAIVPGTLGAVVLATAATGSPLGRPVYRVWMAVAWTVGTLLAVAALAAAYFLVVTPLGLAGRLAGRDRLQRRRPPAGETLWHPLPAEPHDPSRPF